MKEGVYVFQTPGKRVTRTRVGLSSGRGEKGESIDMGQSTICSDRFDTPCKQSGASRNLNKKEKANSENWETKKGDKRKERKNGGVCWNDSHMGQMTGNDLEDGRPSTFIIKMKTSVDVPIQEKVTQHGNCSCKAIHPRILTHNTAHGEISGDVRVTQKEQDHKSRTI